MNLHLVPRVHCVITAVPHWLTQAIQAKKEKEAAKKALRKERKTFRAVCKVRKEGVCLQ